MVITADGVYSKHYYAGSQRIVSRLGSSDAGIFETACVGCKPKTTDNELDAKKLQQAQKIDLQGYADKLKRGTIVYKDYKPVPLAVQVKALQEENATMLENPDGTNSTPLQRLGEEEARRVVPIYYYHPDHLGTSTALTDFNGNAYQFFLNLPFGETMAQQLGNNYYNSPYKFNGKELDEETGFYYYGARYYDPRISIWQSVDPLAEKYPSWSPYNFCYNNPLRFVDPDGRAPLDWRNVNGNLIYDPSKNGGKGGYTKYATAQDKEFGNRLRNSGLDGAIQFNTMVSLKSQDFEISFLDIDTREAGLYYFGSTKNEYTTKPNGFVDEITKTKIEIYTGTAESYAKDIKNGTVLKDNDQTDYQKEDQETIKNNNLSAKDIITATIAHEIGHGNKNNQDLINSKSAASEKEPHRINNQVLKDIAKTKKE